MPRTSLPASGSLIAMQSTRSPVIVGTRYSSTLIPGAGAQDVAAGEPRCSWRAYDAAPNSRSTNVTPNVSSPPPPRSAGMLAAYSPASMERFLI
jgi:hypothetical protein